MFKSKRPKAENQAEEIFQKQKNIQKRLENIKNESSAFILSVNGLKNALKRFEVPKLPFEKRYEKAKGDLLAVYSNENLDTLLKEITEELCGLVPLNDYVIMGFIKRGISNWQIKTSTPILALTKMDPYEKLQVISDILTFASSHMVRAIYSPDMRWKEQMKLKLFHRALETYEEVMSAQDLLVTHQDFSNLHVEKINWI